MQTDKILLQFFLYPLSFALLMIFKTRIQETHVKPIAKIILFKFSVLSMLRVKVQNYESTYRTIFFICVVSELLFKFGWFRERLSTVRICL